LSDSQVEDLHRLFQNEWWTKDRTLEDVRRMLDGSAVTVGFVDPKTDRLLAFMRAITDGVYKVLLLDLVVDPAARKTGLGKKTFEAVLEHPALRDAKHFELYCRPELMTLYRRWGFEELPADIRAMRRVSG
jgi:GNAT superfamily N-acetyltransferase